MNLRVDLNADLGEGAGHDDELFDLITSANIACGFHAGDADSMRKAVEAGKSQGVAVGAHPSFFDRENFGRKELDVSADDVREGVKYQLGVFAAIADAAGVKPSHVKAHGALYNMAARERALAHAIARAVAHFDPTLIVFALPNSELAAAAGAHGLRVAREVFADRNYMADGSLVPRSRPDALLHDPSEAAIRVLRMLRERLVRAVDGSDVPLAADTICVHGDMPGAVAFARKLREALESAGVTIAAPLPMETAGPPAVKNGRDRRLEGEPSPGGPSPGEPSPGGPSPGEPSPREASPGERSPGEPSRVLPYPAWQRKAHRHLPHLSAFKDKPIVFFTTCTFQRRNILAIESCHHLLRSLWERSAEHDGWWVGNYIIMPDHVHLFARAERDAKPLPKWMQMWKNVSSRAIAKSLQISPPVWQAEYFDRYLRSSESYSEKWEYVEQNAVRAGLVPAAKDWPYRGTVHDLFF